MPYKTIAEYGMARQGEIDMNDTTYWNNKGKYEELCTKLDKLIPDEGEVADSKTNNCLEKYRRACNAYYDLFNNGLCNRADEFRTVFGFGGTWIAKTDFPYCEKLERKMDEIILLAGKEQGLVTE
jgi:hypothetical protein